MKSEIINMNSFKIFTDIDFSSLLHSNQLYLTNCIMEDFWTLNSWLSTTKWEVTAPSTYERTGRHIPRVSRYMSRTVLVAMVFKGWPLSPPSSVLYLLFRLSGRWTVVLDTISPSTPLWGKWEHTDLGLYCCVPCYILWHLLSTPHSICWFCTSTLGPVSYYHFQEQHAWKYKYIIL